MLRHHTSTQRYRAVAKPLIRRRRLSVPLGLPDVLRVKTAGRSGRSLDRAPAPIVVNETKCAILAEMQQLGRPVTANELHKIWAERKEHKALGIFEYHLSTLVKAKVVEVAYGPELHFRLVRGA